MNNPPGSFLLLLHSLWIWLFLFVGSLVASLIANGTLGVPYGSVVDVIFALQLAFVALLALCVMTTSFGRGATSILAIVPSLFVCALLPFGAIAGFQLYALLAGIELDDASSVYIPTIKFYAEALHAAGLIRLEASEAIDPALRGLIPLDQPEMLSALKLSIVRLESALIVTSLLLCLMATLLLRATARRNSSYPESSRA